MSPGFVSTCSPNPVCSEPWGQLPVTVVACVTVPNSLTWFVADCDRWWLTEQISTWPNGMYLQVSLQYLLKTISEMAGAVVRAFMSWSRDDGVASVFLPQSMKMGVLLVPFICTYSISDSRNYGHLTFVLGNNAKEGISEHGTSLHGTSHVTHHYMTHHHMAGHTWHITTWHTTTWHVTRDTSPHSTSHVAHLNMSHHHMACHTWHITTWHTTTWHITCDTSPHGSVRDGALGLDYPCFFLSLFPFISPVVLVLSSPSLSHIFVQWMNDCWFLMDFFLRFLSVSAFVKLSWLSS